MHWKSLFSLVSVSMVAVGMHGSVSKAEPHYACEVGASATVPDASGFATSDEVSQSDMLFVGCGGFFE